MLGCILCILTAMYAGDVNVGLLFQLIAISSKEKIYEKLTSASCFIDNRPVDIKIITFAFD